MSVKPGLMGPRRALHAVRSGSGQWTQLILRRTICAPSNVFVLARWPPAASGQRQILFHNNAQSHKTAARHFKDEIKCPQKRRRRLPAEDAGS